MTARIVTADDLVDVAAEVFDVPASDLRSPGRQQPLVAMRQAAMAVARDITGLSYPAIGAAFDRDHTCVINACRRRRTSALVARYADRLTAELLTLPLHVEHWELRVRCGCGWTAADSLPVGASPAVAQRRLARRLAEHVAAEQQAAS